MKLQNLIFHNAFKKGNFGLGAPFVARVPGMDWQREPAAVSATSVKAFQIRAPGRAERL